MLPLTRTLPRAVPRTLPRTFLPRQQVRNSGHHIADPARREASGNPDAKWIVAISGGSALTYGLCIALRWADGWKTE